MKNLVIVLMMTFPFLAKAVTLTITHPRIEQKPARIYEILCELKCSYSINSKNKQKIEKDEVSEELKVIKELSPELGKITKPSAPERGSFQVRMILDNKKIFYDVYVPPATQWTKENAGAYSRYKDAVTKLEFLMEKGRSSK